MQTRVLGKNLTVSAVGLDRMGMTHTFGAPADVKEISALPTQAMELGYILFDTAECYTGIHPDGSIVYNEELVGATLAQPAGA